MHVLSIERKANQALPELASNDVSASANCNCSHTAQCEVWGLDNANVNLQHQQKRPYPAHLRIHTAHRVCKHQGNSIWPKIGVQQT